MRSLSDIWPRQNQSTRPEKTAFVLSGGAAMGALQVGMLRALVERRILPDAIFGCSVGAINGAVLAGGPSLSTVGRIQDVWMDLIDRELVPTGLLPSPVQLVRKGESISTSDGLRDLLDEIVPAPTFEGLEVPFECVATNIDAAEEHWFDAGRLVPAVLASASIPAVFPAVEIGGDRFLDGAIVDEVPVQRAVEAGATRIFVLQVSGIERPRPELRRPIDVALLAYWIARRHRLAEDLARIPEDVEVIMLPHGDPRRVRYNDLSSSAHLMDVAYRASSEHLDALIEGSIPPPVGPLHERRLDDPAPKAESEEDAELETAHRLFDAARAMIGFGNSGQDTTLDVEPVAEVAEDPEDPEAKVRLIERAESIGPAMRALVDRVLDRGAHPVSRHVDADDSESDADQAHDQSAEDGTGTEPDTSGHSEVPVDLDR